MAHQPDATPARVGLWGVLDVEDPGQALYGQVVRSELARRLPAAWIRVFAPLGPARPTRSDRGEPAEALGAWSPGRAAELDEELDFVLVGGTGLLAQDGDRAPAGRFFVEGLGRDTRWHVTADNEAAALRKAGVEGAIDVTCHPAVLASRLFAPAVLAKRLEYLRVMGWYPPGGDALVAQGGGDLVRHAPALRRLLDDRPGTALVVADPEDEPHAAALAETMAGVAVHRLPFSAGHEDTLAVLAAADGFIGSSQAWGATAVGCQTPWVALDTLAGGLVDAFDDAVKAVADGDLADRARDEVDAWLDAVAAATAGAARTRHPHGPPDPSRAALLSELRALRRAYRIRCERSHLERAMLADVTAGTDAELARVRAEVDEVRRVAERESVARSAAEAEVSALRATRTFRWTATARRLYRRLRR